MRSLLTSLGVFLLFLLTGALLLSLAHLIPDGAAQAAIAAMADGIAMGPWDRNPQPTAGRLANYLDSHIMNFAELALQGVKPRIYRKNPQAAQAHNLEWSDLGSRLLSRSNLLRSEGKSPSPLPLHNRA
jgi:hypothetical protein